MRENLTPQMTKALMNYNNALSDLKYAIADAFDVINSNAFDYDSINLAIDAIYNAQEDWNEIYVNLKRTNHPLPDPVYEWELQNPLAQKNEKFEEAV